MKAQEKTHPAPEELADFLHGRLPSKDQQRVEIHVVGCARCCQILETLPPDTLAERLRGPDTPGAAPTHVLRRGMRPGPVTEVREPPPELKNHARYEVLRFLGAGGMGVVFQARHRVMDRVVALKIIHRKLIKRPGALERFHQEVKTAARLSHPNIVTAHDAEQAGNLHFLVMEYVDGTSLGRLVDERGPLPVALACEYVRQAALGLQHAHEQGMVHRDIKPQNLMLLGDLGHRPSANKEASCDRSRHSAAMKVHGSSPAPVIKILDFGLARFAQIHEDAPSSSSGIHDQRDSGLTNADTILGTPDYMAPEQSRDSRAVDIRADIYSLGCTWYFLLSGRPPFSADSAQETLQAQLENEPVPLRHVPAAARKILSRMMAKEPGKRFQTPAAVVEALARCDLGAAATHAATATLGAGTVTGMHAAPGRRLWRGVAAVAASVAGLALLVWGALLWGPARDVELGPGQGAAAHEPGARLPVLFVLAPEFRHDDYAPVRDALKRDGWPVQVASVSKDPCKPLDRNGPEFQVIPDVALHPGMNGKDFAGLVLPGGYIYPFKDNQPPRLAVWKLFDDMNREHKCVAAIDSALMVLVVSNRFDGKKMAWHDKIADKFGRLIEWQREPAVRDCWLVTAASAKHGDSFARKILDVLNKVPETR